MSIHCMFPQHPPFMAFRPGSEEHPLFGPGGPFESTDNNNIFENTDDRRGFGGPRGRGHHHRGGPDGGRGRGGHGRGGPHFGFGPGPQARGREDPFEDRRGGMFGPRGGHHGPRGGHHHHGPPPHRPHHRGRGPWNGPVDFNSFLENFAAEMDPAHAHPGHRHGRWQPRDSQVDFVPRADVFNAPNEYVVHVSLPGAQKSDINVDYDSEESTLRLTGVIHRPEFSEELHEAMILDERHREVGVFERSIKLGTPSEPANVDHEKLSAKLNDGVLVVRLPKSVVDPEQSKKKVTIESDIDADNNYNTQETEKGIETNEKHASMVEIPDESDTMHVDTETETGGLLEEVDEASYTPSHVSGEDLDDAEEAKEYIKVDVQ